MTQRVGTADLVAQELNNILKEKFKTSLFLFKNLTFLKIFAIIGSEGMGVKL